MEEQPDLLAGRRVLIVEDEFYLADDLSRVLVGHGAAVTGVANTLERARALIHDAIDLAVLDLNLKGEMVFPVADELRQRGVPFVFTTGYGLGAVPAEYDDVERWEKPLSAHLLARALARL